MYKDTFIKQTSRNECAIICVNAIAEFFGIKIVNKSFSSSTFLSIKDLIEYAESVGLNHYVFRSSYSWLLKEELPTPFIVHLEGNHFVVVNKIKKLKVVIFDPAFGGQVELTKKEFVGRWVGHIKSPNAWKEGVVIYLEK